MLQDVCHSICQALCAKFWQQQDFMIGLWASLANMLVAQVEGTGGVVPDNKTSYESFVEIAREQESLRALDCFVCWAFCNHIHLALQQCLFLKVPHKKIN